MVTKTLSITNEAYEILKGLKQPNESFSQLIIRLTKQQGNPERILTTLKQFTKNDPEINLNLADSIEKVYLSREKKQLRKIDL